MFSGSGILTGLLIGLVIGLLGLALSRVRWAGSLWFTVVAAGVAGAVLSVLGDLVFGAGGALLTAAAGGAIVVAVRAYAGLPLVFLEEGSDVTPGHLAPRGAQEIDLGELFADRHGADRVAHPGPTRTPDPPAGGPGAVFLSYRRADGGFAARSIADVLRARRGGRVFMDVDSIGPGADFHRVVQDSIRSSAVVLVVIGDRWLDPGADGRPRLLEPDDNVRIEIEYALAIGVRVLPVLVDGTPMPRPGQLPESLRELTRLNATHIRHASWDADASVLVGAVTALARG